MKTFEQFNAEDPYGEENWNDDPSFEKGDYLIAKKDKFKDKKRQQIFTGKRYKILKINRLNNTRIFLIIVPGVQVPVAVIREEQMKEYFDRE